MPNRIMTKQEVLDEVCKPLVDAIRADIAAHPGEQRVYTFGDCMPLVVNPEPEAE